MGSPAFNPSGSYSAVTFDPKAAYDPAPAATTSTQAAPEGFWHSLGAAFGVTPEDAQARIQNMKDHPVKAALAAAAGPAWELAKGVGSQVKQSAGEVSQAADAINHGSVAGMAQHLIQSVPIVGPAISKGADQYASGDYAGEFGTLLGASAQAAPMVAGAVDSRFPNRPTLQNPSVPVSDAVSAAKMKLRPSSSPAIVPPAEIQAQKIAQSILPPGGIKPEHISSIQAEAPAVVEYARRTGNPLNTQAEGLKAAQGVAKEGLAHFNDKILGPVAGDKVTLGAGQTDLGNSATLGQISDEISSLNKQVNTAKASSAGDALTVMAKKGGVMDQLAYLRGVLYDNLSTKTGISPEDLQTLREGYGGQFTMADALESGGNARLTRTGKASQGVTDITTKKPGLMEVPGMAVNALRGGEQAIADRQFSSAMRDIQPQAPVRPIPNPPMPISSVRGAPIRGESTPVQTFDTTPQPSMTEGNVAARNATRQAATQVNAAAAKQEFLRQHELQQAAQDAAAGRDQRVAGYRAVQGATQQAGTQLEGEAARTVGRDRVIQTWADQGAARLTSHGLDAESVKVLNSTPEGRQLLVRASSLTPGSKMMDQIVVQAKGLIKQVTLPVVK